MSLATRSILFLGSVLILAMIVRDPHQAHRPPDLRIPSTIAFVASDAAG